MNKGIHLLLAALFFTISLHAQTASKRTEMQHLIKENFALADTQYRYMMTLTPPNRLPQSYDENNKKFDARDITWWCSGFYPGSLWYIYEQTNDPVIRKEAERTLKLIESNQSYTGNHDLGFMMFCSFGNAYRLTKDPKYEQVIMKSSESLITRYRPSIQSIQSWNKNKNFNCPVIIDNMMNLEMLCWATDNGGSNEFKKIANLHSQTTIKNHFRPDYSSYHVVDYDLQTGKVIRRATWQGAANSSAWARGQAWALYGFTTIYRFTKNKVYLRQAQKIAAFILDHPDLPEDKIPYWDFDAHGIPFAKRDASAGAIMASALLELGRYTTGIEKAKYIRNAEKMLESLSSTAYRAKAGENGGFLLQHSVGALPLNSEIDVPLIYADYYFLEALKRYKDWYL